MPSFSHVHYTEYRAILAFSVFDEVMESISGVIVYVLGQVVDEGLVNGIDVGLYMMTNDIRYALGRFFDSFKAQWLVEAVK